jgi:hypothetical protein
VKNDNLNFLIIQFNNTNERLTMKKLLITSALTGAMISVSAFAQTTVTGELRAGFKGISNKQPYSSNRGFGAEQQINVQTKGKTNVGFDYAAGFSLENDGESTTQTGTLYNENAYFDFISGNTTLSISRDHIQRSDSGRSNGVLFGYDPLDTLNGMFNLAGDSSILFQQSIGAAPSQNYGIAVLQTIPDVGRLSVNYVPENTQAGASEASFPANGEAESAYEIGFDGSFGVKGLNVYAFKNEEKKRMGETKKREGENYGIKYTMGQTSVGYTRKEHTGSASLSKTLEVKENHYGVAYAVTPTFTIGANYFKADGGGTAADAKVRALQIGYNLGPVALTAGYAKAENVLGGTADVQDADGIGFVRLIGAF